MGDAGIFIEKSVHIETQKMILNQLKLIWYGDRIVMKTEREGVIKMISRILDYTTGNMAILFAEKGNIRREPKY